MFFEEKPTETATPEGRAKPSARGSCFRQNFILPEKEAKRGVVILSNSDED